MESKRTRGEFMQLIQDEKRMNLPSFENRIKRDKAKATGIRKKTAALKVLQEKRRKGQADH